MISPITIKTESLDKNIVQASSYLPKPKPKQVISPLVEFLNKDFRVPEVVVESNFAELMQPAELSYKISHGVVGQKLNVVVK